MTWSGFEALPPYFGGKRKLCPRIFKEISRVLPRERWMSATFADPFLGGGAVSLYAKARGFAVHCGDIAQRSAVIGKALIANQSMTLSEDDVRRLFVTQGDARDYLQRTCVPDHFTAESARFLDNAWAVARAVASPTKQALLRLLLMKYLFSLRPHSKFSSPGAFNRPFAEGRYDDIKPTYRQAIAANAAHPARALRRLRQIVNRAVFRGAQVCHSWQGEASATIACTGCADVLYLDPPYAGTLRYEKEYELLDRLFGDELAPSPYSAEQGLERLGELLENCSQRLWVISYGNAVASLEEVKAVIERYRPARAVELEYAHLQAVASAEKSSANREFIILAGEGVT